MTTHDWIMNLTFNTTYRSCHKCTKAPGASCVDGFAHDSARMTWRGDQPDNLSKCPWCGEKLPETVEEARRMAEEAGE